MKNKRLEKELEGCHQNLVTTESKLMQLERELETLRAHGSTTSHQFEQLKRQFNDLLVCETETSFFREAFIVIHGDLFV